MSRLCFLASIHFDFVFFLGDNTRVCSMCNKSYSNTTNLNIHMKTVHENPFKTAISCEYCDKNMPNVGTTISSFHTFPGGSDRRMNGNTDNRANRVHLQLQLSAGTELGNSRIYFVSTY